MGNRKIYFLSFIIASTFYGCNSEKKVKPQETSIESKTENILFIGNSYTYRNGGVDYHLQKLTSGMEDINASYITRAAQGKFHLYSHWEDEKTLAKLEQKKWDKVILQEYSSGPVTEPKDFFKFGKKWNNKLRAINPSAKLFLYATWGYKGTKTMVDSLNTQYQKLATQIRATKVPVGMLWKSLMNEVNLFDADGAHPNRKGTFLNACLFYEYIFEKDVTKTTHFDNVIPKNDQKKLKNWAHQFHLKNPAL